MEGTPTFDIAGIVADSMPGFMSTFFSIFMPFVVLALLLIIIKAIGRKIIMQLKGKSNRPTRPTKKPTKQD